MKIGTLTVDIDADTRGLDKGVVSSERAMDKLDGKSRELTGSMRGLRLAIAATAGAMAVRHVARYSDSFTNLQSRLKLVTESTSELTAVTDELLAVSQRTRMDAASTADLYSRLAMSTERLGLSYKDLTEITETISQALIVGGGSAESMNAAVIQLGQGIASGTLRGEELNSVLEQAPRLAKAIADGMGVAVGDLRALAAEGQITAESVVSALRSQAASIEEDFGKVAPTISQAMTLATNSLLEFIGKSKLVRSAAQTIVDVVQELTREASISELVAELEKVEDSALFTARGRPGEAARRRAKALREEIEALKQREIELKKSREADADGRAEGITDAQKKALNSRLEAVRRGLMTEQELLAANVEAEAEILRQSLENKLITEAEFNALGLEQKAQHEAELTRIEQDASEARIRLSQLEAQEKQQQFDTMFRNLATLMNTRSRKLFEIGKVAAIANTIMDTHEAAMSSFKWGAKIGGPALGAAMAGAAIAAGAARVQAIQSTSFGGSSGVAGGAGGAAGGVAGAGAAGAQSSTLVSIQGLNPGSLFSGDQVRDLIERINKAQEDGIAIVRFD